MGDLREPARYFPLRKGRYEVTPGLSPLGTDFGNGVADERLFQFDRNFPRYLANKRACCAENPGKYCLQDVRFDDAAQETICRLLVECLTTEYPEWFVRSGETLVCHLTDEQVSIHDFAALCSQFSEDIAVVQLPPGQPDATIALHVTAPSHWRPSEKIGISFLATHKPVPHFEKIAQASVALMQGILTRGPFVRFNWGLECTDRLNLHPDAPPGQDAVEWNRRRLAETDACPLYLRIERQVLWGLPEASLWIFTIRVYPYPVTELTAEERSSLISTLHSMPHDSRIYKTLDGCFDEVIAYLERFPTAE